MPLAPLDWRASARNDAVRAWPIELAISASVYLAYALGVFLAIRRCSGALDGVLPPAQLILTATLLLAWAMTIRVLARGQLAAWLPAGVLLLFALACSFPGGRVVDWIVWLTVCGVFVAAQDVLAVAPARGRSRALNSPQKDRVLQELTRSRTAEGQDFIRGTLLAEFAAGERIAMLYVAFCPPFERLPRVELDSNLDAKLVQALHNGAQLEVRLPCVAKTATSATVEFYATDAD